MQTNHVEYSIKDYSRKSVEALVTEVTLEWYKTGLQKFPQEIHEIYVTYDLGGKTAGTACREDSGRFHIQYNPMIMVENLQEFLNDTVPHEVAHLIADEFFKEMWPKGVDHSSLWKFVMIKFGKNPQRCHDYEVEHLHGKRATEEFVMEVI